MITKPLISNKTLKISNDSNIKKCKILTFLRFKITLQKNTTIVRTVSFTEDD